MMKRSTEKIFRKVTFESAFGPPIVKVCEIIGMRYHGYDTPSGGWAAAKGEGCTPAEWIVYREKGRRKKMWCNKKHIIEIEGMLWRPL